MAVMSVTFGVSLTHVGAPLRLTARVHASTRSGLLPIAAPYPSAWGQERFSSKPATFPENHPATVANSSGVPPKMLATTALFSSGAISSRKSFEGLGRPMAFRRPFSSTTRQGPACPSFGTGPIDFVTTPPAPRLSIRERDAPVVPRIPAARIRWLSSVTPPTETLPGLIDTIHQKMDVKKYKGQLIRPGPEGDAFADAGGTG